jgi:hypothetical protein
MPARVPERLQFGREESLRLSGKGLEGRTTFSLRDNLTLYSRTAWDTKLSTTLFIKTGVLK